MWPPCFSNSHLIHKNPVSMPSSQQRIIQWTQYARSRVRRHSVFRCSGTDGSSFTTDQSFISLKTKNVIYGFSSLLRQRTHSNRWKVLQECGLLWHSCKIQLHFHERSQVVTIQGSFCKFNDNFPTSIGCTGTCIDKRNRW